MSKILEVSAFSQIAAIFIFFFFGISLDSEVYKQGRIWGAQLSTSKVVPGACNTLSCFQTLKSHLWDWCCLCSTATYGQLKPSAAKMGSGGAERFSKQEGLCIAC